MKFRISWHGLSEKKSSTDTSQTNLNQNHIKLNPIFSPRLLTRISISWFLKRTRKCRNSARNKRTGLVSITHTQAVRRSARFHY